MALSSLKPPCHPGLHDFTVTPLSPDILPGTLSLRFPGHAPVPSPHGVSRTWAQICIISLFPAWVHGRYLERFVVGPGGQFDCPIGRIWFPIGLLMAGKVPMEKLSPTDWVSLKFLSGLCEFCCIVFQFSPSICYCENFHYHWQGTPLIPAGCRRFLISLPVCFKAPGSQDA